MGAGATAAFAYEVAGPPGTPGIPVSGSGSGSTEPAPIAGLGYHQVWAEEFDTFSGGTWGEGIWYDPGSPANSIFVQNGVLNLVSRRSQGYQDITVSTEGGTNPTVFEQGYFEARMRWTKGNGAWPAFWLTSYRHATNPNWPNPNPFCPNNGLPAAECYASEIDVFEGQGREPNVFYGTLHRNSCAPGCNYGVPNSSTDGYHPVGTDLTVGYHTYGMLWTATQIKWYLDDTLLMTAPVYDSTNQPQFLILQMWIGGWTGGTDASTPDVLETQVDYVSVWQM